MQLNETQLRAAVNALHVAAVQYTADAHIVDDATPAGDRLRDCFKAQAAEALSLAEVITSEIG